MTQGPIEWKRVSSPAKRAALLGLLSGLAVALSALEGLIPPLPFMPPGAKAGLSNIATMFAACYIGLPGALSVAIIKSLFVLITRGGTSFFMSIAGGLVSTVFMWLFLRFGKFGLVGTGIAGAVAHNSAQLAVSILLTGTPALLYYYPALLVFAMAAGSITGIILKVVLSATQKLL